MPIPQDKILYEQVKKQADQIYKKHSGYKSGYIVRTYTSLDGKYIDDGKPKKLKQWYREKWSDIGNKEYPVYRPTRRVNKSTPLTLGEIDKNNLKNQIKLKQIIKGEYNLPAFKKK